MIRPVLLSFSEYRRWHICECCTPLSQNKSNHFKFDQVYRKKINIYDTK
jgi:hypothetical protein